MEHRIKEAKGTILIYKGEPICYNILNTFAEQLGEALQRLGEEVEYFDVKQSGEAALAAYAGKTYQAVIGFQSYLFDIYLPKAGVYLHDLIKGPKINFQFDHPIWMKNHYIRMPEHCYIATHDRNYAAFIEKYYPRIAGSSIIFPGGCEKAAGENGKQEAERNLRGAQDKKEYQISFIGTYTDYRSYLPLIRNSQGIIKKIAAHFLFRMKQHPEETAEKALEESLRKDGIVLSDEEFLEVLDGVKPMIYCIMSYYREKAVKVILEAGITLEVFGDSWKKSPFGDSPYLRIHEAVDMRESLEVMEKSLISFNVMAWHKDGFTERIANSMLQHKLLAFVEDEIMSDGTGDMNLLFPEWKDKGVDRICLFGAGDYGKRMLNELQLRGFLVHSYIDNDEKKWNTRICGIPCYGMDYLVKHQEHTAVIVSALAEDEIKLQLKKNNIKYIKKYSEIYKKLFYCEPLKSVLKENLKHEHEVEA